MKDRDGKSSPGKCMKNKPGKDRQNHTEHKKDSHNKTTHLFMIAIHNRSRDNIDKMAVDSGNQLAYPAGKGLK